MREKQPMEPDLGRIYNDYMQEAHSGQRGQYSNKERKPPGSLHCSNL